MRRMVAMAGIIMAALASLVFTGKLLLAPEIKGGVEFHHVVVSEGATLEVRDRELRLTSPSGTLGVGSPLVAVLDAFVMWALLTSTLLSSALLWLADRRRAAAAAAPKKPEP